jgi:hypothetical protein
MSVERKKPQGLIGLLLGSSEIRRRMIAAIAVLALYVASSGPARSILIQLENP